MIGSFHAVVIDTPDPDRAAHFYAELLGMVRVQDDEDFVVIGDAADRPGLGFARVSDNEPTTWPDPTRPQYRHLDVRVQDLASATQAAVALGARPLAEATGNVRVLADPDGHPFCLVQF